MRVRIISFWDEIRSSYWFVPGLMVLGAMLLSYVTVAADRQAEEGWVNEAQFLWSGGPEGARELLSSVAQSMITVAGVTFSITIVAFAQASSQFGPRLLRSFMRDTGNQVVLGTFVATFAFCLLTLRTVRSIEGNEFVPYISVTVAMLLALASLGVLIYFFHHASRSIQAPVVIADVAHELLGAIEHIFPQHIGSQPTDQGDQAVQEHLPEQMEQQQVSVEASSEGYLQAVDNESLMHQANEHDLVLRIMFHPGNFIVKGSPLVRVWPGGRITDDLRRQIGEAFVLGKQRTQSQDIEYSIDHLVEVAVRSLSPSINDPFTVITCIDWLGAALSQLAECPFPSRYRYNQDGQLRIIVDRPQGYPSLVKSAFDLIRENAGTSVAVRMRMLEAMAAIMAHTYREDDREALLQQAGMILRDSRRLVPMKEDLDDIAERYQRVLAAIPRPAPLHATDADSP
ncbi:MAG: DUF2254 domain-containing protein [Anaerolineae bacterium]